MDDIEKVIVFPRPDGGVSVMIPTAEGLAMYGSLDAMARAKVPADTPYEVLDRSQLPQDRVFRNAWEFSNE